MENRHETCYWITASIHNFSNCFSCISKEDFTAFEKQFHIKLPKSIESFYIKNNGGIPNYNWFNPQNKKLDYVEINMFLPIKYSNQLIESIEDIAIREWNKKTMPKELLPFAIDSGGNYYTINIKNKKIYLYLKDQWNDNFTVEKNFRCNAIYISQSFQYFISNLCSIKS